MDRRQVLKRTSLLAGLTLGAGTISNLLQSCQQTDRTDWQPQFFSPDQVPTISGMIDVILPKTETPGGLDLKVDLFVDLMFAKALSPADQDHLKTGYKEMTDLYDQNFGKSFLALSDTEKVKALKLLGKHTNQFNPSIWGSTLGEQPPIDFYRRLRQFTLLGYFSTEEVGKNILAYDPIPGEFDGCFDMPKDHLVWTL